jgi:ribose transport system permease protein
MENGTADEESKNKPSSPSATIDVGPQTSTNSLQDLNPDSIEDGSRTASGFMKSLAVLRPYGLIFVFVILFAIFCITQPATFATWGNLRAILETESAIIVLAVGVTFPMRCGDFDLSVGPLAVFCGVMADIVVVQHGASVPLGILTALGIGALVGLFNGVFVVLFGLPAFVVTLGTMTILGGLALAVTGSQIVGSLTPAFSRLGTANIVGSFPLIVIYGWALAALVWYVQSRTPFGRYTLFVGGNSQAARLAGVPVKRIRIISFVLSGLIAGIAGLILLTGLGALDPTSGAEYLVAPYAGVFLGATTIDMGRFNIPGTIVGLYLIAMGTTGLELIGAASWVTGVFDGGVLIVAIAVAKLLGGTKTALTGSGR